MNSKKFDAVFGRAGQLPRAVYAYYQAHPWFRLALSALAAFVPIWVICLSSIDFDYGWHLQAGNYIRQHGIPSHDVFSYTARDFRWINHEWLSDVIMSKLYDLFGYGFLALLSAALWTLALLLAAGRRANPLLLFLAAITVSPYVAVRPTVVTALFFALVLVVLRRGVIKYYWFLPLLFIAWANLHAGFISGLALVGYFTVMRRSKPLALVFGLCLAATFCNAYGVRIYDEILRTLFNNKLHAIVQEWSSFYIVEPSQLYIVLWAAGFWLYQKPFWFRWLRLAPILLLASLSANRNIPLFVLASLQDVARYSGQAAAAIPRKLDRPRKLVIGLIAGCLLAFMAHSTISAFSRVHADRETSYPLAAVSYLQAHDCPGQLFNNYNYGGYLIWKLPSQPVYIDGRMPTWGNYLDRYVKLSADPAKLYKAEFAKYDIQCALLSNGFDKEMIDVLHHDGWRTVSHTRRSSLLFSPVAHAGL